MKIFPALLFTLFSVSVHAQQKHFIYIQSDNRQPFYVKQDKKIMSSTPAGYLIIPKLFSGTYDFFVGFPKDEFPEQKFTCVVGETDAGYQLKNLGEKGWGLFNFQSMELLIADATYKKDSLNASVPRDAFAEVLSKVVNDPGIKVVEEIKQEKQDSAKTEIPQQETRSISNKASRAKVAKKPLKETVRRRPVNKLKENKTNDSLSLTYVDRFKGRKDTINVVFPLNETMEAGGVELTKTDTAISNGIPVVKTEPPVADTIRSMGMNQPVDESVSTILKNKKQEEITPVTADTSARQTSVGLPPVTDTVKPVSAEVTADGSVSTIVKQKKPVTRNDSGEFPVNKNILVTDTAAKQVTFETVVNKVTAADSLPSVAIQSTVPVSNDTAVVQENKTANIQVVNSTDQWAVKSDARKDSAMVIAVEKPLVTATLMIVADTPALKEQVNNRVTFNKTDSATAVFRDTALTVQPVEDVREKVTGVDSVLPEVKTDSVKTVQISQPVVSEKPVVKDIPQPVVAVSKPLRNCTAYADDDEYLNLRKKMDRSRDNESQMLSMAHKLFEKRCFNTKQLQRISLLFQSNEGKYKFFDDAYNHTSDPENFPSLITELTDDYYKRRFQAMLR